MLERMLLRIPARLRRPRALLATPRDSAAVRLPLAFPIRTYATPGRPKSVVGEPSRPVKRAVKKAAARSADGTSAAEKQIAAKKRSPRALTPEQAEKRQATAGKKAARDAGLKEKAALRKAIDKKKTKLEDLKAAALPDAPKKAQYTSAYQVYWAEYAKSTNGADAKITARVKDAAAKWKQLPAADVEHYNHLLRTSRVASEAEYKSWIESHTPDQIRLANLARIQLRRQFPTQKSKWVELQDERRPKRAQTPYLSFNVNRQASGDFANIKLAERAKLIAQEWRALSESEKGKYQQLFKQDHERYVEEFTRVYGRAPSPKQTAVAVTA